MFFKKTPVTAAELDSPSTVIGKGVYLESACMSGQESIRIEGMYKGLIDIEGSLVLGETGSITGDVVANYFLVAGEVNGNIQCTTQLHLVSTARVLGDVQAPSLIADEGSQVSGRFIIGADRLSQGTLRNSEEILRIQNMGDAKEVINDFEGI